MHLSVPDFSAWLDQESQISPFIEGSKPDVDCDLLRIYGMLLPFVLTVNSSLKFGKAIILNIKEAI